MDQDCIGSKYCDKFLNIDIANRELVLREAKKNNIDLILTSATEPGNVTACYVGEELKLNTNSYQTALNTTNKKLMKELFVANDIPIAEYRVIQNESDLLGWDFFPCIVKPVDSSAGRGVTYCESMHDAVLAINKAKKYSNSEDILIERYIDGKQYSCESISCSGEHQFVAINEEFIKSPPYVMELGHTIPAPIDVKLEAHIKKISCQILDVFNIQFGASHIEMKVDSEGQIYIIEIASRTGGMRTEMINLASGISYSQLLILSSMNMLNKIPFSITWRSVQCRFLVDYEAYRKYLKFKQSEKYIVLEPFPIPKINEEFLAENIGQSKGYFWVLLKGDKGVLK